MQSLGAGSEEELVTPLGKHSTILLGRALKVSSKVIAFILRVARIASLSAIDVSSVELGTWRTNI